MILRKVILTGALLGIAAAVAAPARAQSQAQCTRSQDTAVQCFATYALKTGLFTLHYGMTATQFNSYGTAVSKIIQTPQTNLVLFGMASSVADAMPPTNADGSANQTAQTNAVNAIVVAEVSSGLVTMPAETTQQDLQWFSLDMATQMDANKGILLSPGTLLRIIDSYVVPQTSNGSVNWTVVNSNLASMVGNLSTLGLLKLPPSMTTAQVTTFAQSLALIIYDYKVATNRKAL